MMPIIIGRAYEAHRRIVEVAGLRAQQSSGGGGYVEADSASEADGGDSSCILD